MQEWVRAVAALAVFMIFAELLVTLRPREQYERYLDLLMNLLVILIFIGFITKFDLRGGTFYERLYDLTNENAYIRSREGDEDETIGDIEISEIEIQEPDLRD